MTQQDLENLFTPFGLIITSRILCDNITGKKFKKSTCHSYLISDEYTEYYLSPILIGLSKGVGFIRFDQRAEAERAIQSLNGTTPKGATEPITVKFANNPSSNLNKALPPLAAYLTPQSNRRFAGPIHHPTGRFR